MNTISIEPSEVTGLATALSTNSVDIAQALTALMKRADNLVSLWTGDAANQYLVAQQSWGQSLARINQILQQAANVADETATLYDKTDAAVGALWSL